VTYSLTARAILGFLCLYFVLGGVAFLTTPDHEAYPFFSWALFRSVPQRTDWSATLRVTSADGTELSRPLPLAEASEYFDASKVDNYNFWLRQFVVGIELKDSGIETEARRRIEAGFTAPVTYELVKLTIDTVNYWKTGRVAGESVVGTFSTP
jgi:hypothetical protein